MHPEWTKVTAETREGANVGSGVIEKAPNRSTTGVGERSGSDPTMGAGNKLNTVNHSTSGSTATLTNKETEMNHSGTANEYKESEGKRITQKKGSIHRVTKDGGKIYRLRGRGDGRKHDKIEKRNIEHTIWKTL